MTHWQEFNHMLTTKTMAAAVSVFTTVQGVLTLENAEHLTSIMGLVSLTIGIIVGVLTIGNIALRTRMLKREDARKQELHEKEMKQ